MWSNMQVQVQNFQEKLKSLPKIKPLEWNIVLKIIYLLYLFEYRRY